MLAKTFPSTPSWWQSKPSIAMKVATDTSSTCWSRIHQQFHSHWARSTDFCGCPADWTASRKPITSWQWWRVIEASRRSPRRRRFSWKFSTRTTTARSSIRSTTARRSPKMPASVQAFSRWVPAGNFPPTNFLTKFLLAGLRNRHWRRCERSCSLLHRERRR